MALTVDYRQPHQGGPAFARGLLDEVATLLLNGEAEASRLLMRDVNH